ncbi:gamma tubulin complex Spc97/GCP2 subunit Alp4, partial [Dispira parvispora]
MLKRLDVRPDHRPVPLPAEDTAPKLQGQSLLIQQQLIVEDVLYVLGGIPGQYLYLQPTAPDTSLLYQPTDPAETSPEGILRQIRQVYQWYIHPSLDSSLAVVITPLLTLGSHYIMVQEFIREYSPMRAGQVNQALCAAIRDMLQEYHTLIAQLEHLHRRATVRDPFTLQKVSFYVQPSARVFERLVVLICTMKRKTEQEFRMLRRKEYQEYLEQCQTHPTSALPSYTSDSYTATKFGTVTNVANEAQYFQGVTAPPEHPRDPNLYPTADQGMISFDELEPVRGSADTAVGQNQPRGDLSKRLVVCRGGRTLKVIAEQMTATGGDPMAKRLYGFLLSRSARPFFRMLQTWLRCGEVEDPWKEFMIRRNDSSKKKAGPGEGLFAETLDHLGASEGSPSAGLVHRHLICLDMTPSFLHLVCKKVLLSGTYLNIIRACKTNAYSSSTAEDLCMMDIEPDASQDRLFAEESFIGMETLESGRETVDTHHSDAVTEAFDGQLHILKIENAYRYANKTLLWILLEQNQLLNRL